MGSIQLQLLEVELIDFFIENEKYEKNLELTSVNDHRPIVSQGHSRNQNFIEFTINVKSYKEGKICSITSTSRFTTFYSDSNYNRRIQ